MPRIPMYESRADNTGITSQRTISSGVMDTITNPTLVLEKQAELGKALTEFGSKLATGRGKEMVGNLLTGRKQESFSSLQAQDRNLFMQKKLNEITEETNKKFIDIQNKSGKERLKAIYDYTDYINNLRK